MADAAAHGPIGSAIVEKLAAAFAPSHLDVVNESANHNVRAGSETHFKVVVISQAFAGKALLERHRAVNETLAAELANGVHALSIVAKTPEQWAKSHSVPESPDCMGGAHR